MKALLKAILPRSAVRLYSRLRLQNKYQGLSTEQIFSTIYATNAWGGRPGQFSSGLGSDARWTEAYCRFVSEFIELHHIKTTLDLGCGDFRVGSALPGDVIGVDIVPALIDHNRTAFPRNQFRCLDMITDELPPAELCLIRQVFQHLSNTQILEVLRKLGKYQHVLVTEHQWDPCRKPNVDKLPGPHIREHSGVFLEKAPFNVDCARVLETQLAPNEFLRTVLIRPATRRAPASDQVS